MDIDVSQVRKLAVDLGVASVEVLPAARAVLQKGALNIKNQLRSEAQGSGIAEAAALAAFITYESKQLAGGVAAEIGPEKGAAGSFAFLYYGNSKNGPVLPDPVRALDTEASNVQKYLGDIVKAVL